MSKLSAIKKQIAALQAEAERITKQEMSAAIAKVKGLMSEFGLTIEHLTQSVVGKPAAKKAKAAKAKTASVAKYADPETGKTWSGFGRAPAWIAGAKNRDDFLVGAVQAKAKSAAPKKATATKAGAPAARRVKSKATAKAAAKNAEMPKAPTKRKLAAKPTAVKRAVAKKVAKAKAVAKKAAPRKAAANVSTPASIASAPSEA